MGVPLKMGEPRTYQVFEVNNVQRSRTLIKVVSVAPRVKAEQRTQKQPDCGLVGHDEATEDANCPLSSLNVIWGP